MPPSSAEGRRCRRSWRGGGANRSRGVDSFGKHVFDLPEAPEPRPVDAVFVLDVSQTADITIGRLGPSDACLALVANCFAQDPAHLEDAGRRLGLAADIAAEVPVFRLAYPRDFSAIPRVAAEILQALPDHGPDQQD